VLVWIFMSSCRLISEHAATALCAANSPHRASCHGYNRTDCLMSVVTAPIQEMTSLG
jgi:hypothetical protein